MAMEYDAYILVIDAGLMFPEEYMPGIDLVIPDFHYLKENRHKVKAVVLTHGHEDHIGALPFFLREFSVPIFGTGFTLELLNEKLKEHQLAEKADLRKIQPGDVQTFGPFQIEFIQVNHSIVDGVGLAVDTPEGTIIHSGDFRIDHTPVDRQFTDLIRFAHYGENKVLALFSDSTNAEKEGFTLSECTVRKTLEALFHGAHGRIIVASFASNITRIQEVIDLAIQFDRKVVFNGKSMVTNVEIAKRLGFLNIPEGTEIKESSINQFSDKKIALVTTGSQGEPMSALARMARGQHKNIKIRRGDTIILSSRFIPGNEKTITFIINNLYRMGADVVYEKVSDIHTSGHAKREELKVMLRLTNPRYFIPIHGEYRHLVKHAQLALDMGMPKENVCVVENGDVVCFENQTLTIAPPVVTGRNIVDGKGIGDVGDIILRDRRKLSAHGMVIVLIALNEHTGDIVYGPDIIPRGVVFEDQAEPNLEDAKAVVLEVFEEFDHISPLERTDLEADIRKRLKRFLYNTLEKNPMILPIIILV